MDALIANARFHFHKQLFETNTLTLTTAGVASNADTSSRGSKAIARRIVDILVEEQHHAVSTVDKISGQTLGKQFETLTMEFLRETFPYLQNLRPGNWTILQLGNNNKLKTSDFAQYEHLAYLNALTTQNAQLAAALGNDYLVAPDVVVYRDLYEDNGVYLIGNGDYLFETRWSRAGNDSIHAYGLIGYRVGESEFPAPELLPSYDFSSRCRTISTGQIVVFENLHRHFAAVKLGMVKSSSHGYPCDEMSFEYHIYNMT